MKDTRNSKLGQQSDVVLRAASLFWIVFLVWTAVGAVVMPMEIGEVNVQRMVAVDGLREALVFILRVSDAVWMVMAFATVYLFTLLKAGAGVARRAALVVVAGSALIEAVGERTGFPFGDYAYTDNMGVRIAGVLPFTIPLAWFVILGAGQWFAAWWKPRWPVWKQSALVAALATLTDLNLEFIAWKVRAYWIWYPPGTPLSMDPPAWPPLQNYVSWFVVSFILAAAMPRFPKRAAFPLRPVGVLLLMNALFLLVHLVRWIRPG